MNKRLAAVILVLVLVLPAAVLAFLGSELGSRLLLLQLLPHLPGKPSISSVHGRLLDNLEVNGFHYQTDTETINIEQFLFAWRPSQLLRGKLTIDELALHGLDIQLTPSQQPQPASSFNFNAKLALPLQIQLHKLLLTNAKLTRGEFVQPIEKLQLSLFSEAEQLTLTRLQLDAKPINADAHGQIKLGKGFPLTFNADWQVHTDSVGAWQGATQLSGDLQHLLFNNQLSAPFKLSVNGRLQDALATPTINLRAEWPALQWPLGGAELASIKTEHGVLEVSGQLSNYQLSLNTQLLQAKLPKTAVQLNAQGSQSSLHVEQLQLAAPQVGLLQVGGDLDWANEPAFSLAITGQKFNPAIILPELPGNLSFTGKAQGKLGTPLTIAAEINQLSGQLRNYPVSANGKARLSGEQLQVQALKVTTGSNSLSINGSIDKSVGKEQAALDVVLNAPALAQLWPTLRGALQLTGKVQGAWLNPALTMQAKGKQLGLAEQRIRQLALNVAYDPASKKPASLSLLAENVSSGKFQIAKLKLQGRGLPEQHHLDLDLSSNQGDLALAVDGRYQNPQWLGVISQLQLARAELGLWQSQKPGHISAQHSPAGISAVIEPVCLHQDSAALCVAGRYADRNSQAQLVAKALPGKLLKAYLPEQLSVLGALNADVQIQQQNQLLTGNYQAMVTPTTVTIRTEHNPVEMRLGGAKLSGTIKANTVSADLDVALLNRDYVRARLQLDTGRQAVSGQVSAQLDEFAMLAALQPKLANLNGHFAAQVGVNGSLTKPVFNGRISFANGQFDLADYGLGFRDLNLQAEALTGNSNHIQFKASMTPTALKAGVLAEHLQLQGLLQMHADIWQQNGHITGDYRLDIPANTITVLQPVKKALAAGFLTGHSDARQHSAEAHFNLIGNDFIHAQMQLANDSTQNLSGRLQAAMTQFALLNPLLPELANLKGQLNADLNLTGTLKKPIASGAVNLRNGAFDVTEMGLTITDIKLQAQADAGEHILLSGFAKSGPGTVNLNGVLDLAELSAQPISAHVTGSNFDIIQIPEAQIAISPDLNFVVKDGKGKLSGLLKISKASLQLEQVPENAVNVSKDEIILGAEPVKQDQQSAAALDANIDIDLGKAVSFSGQGLQTNLTGKLKIIKTAAKMSMHGDVAMDKGRYKSYGQDLTIRKGKFVFNGPVDNPWLDVEAIRLSKDKKVTAILTVSGQLSEPKTKVSSDPALPETEALAYLITGKSLNQVSKSENTMLASAALSYGAGKASWLTSKLGIDEFDIEEGETLQDSLVSVGQYLTPDFYVGTKVGLFNKQASLILKYMITDSLNVETQTGSSKRVKLNYEFNTD